MTGIVPPNAPYRHFAAFYDALLGDQAFPETRLAFDRICDRHAVRFASAADIGCGTGTFVEHLCRTTTGAVWGIDLSPQMLEVAAAKNAGNRAQFLCQDMRQLHLPQPVDLITCQFEAMNYLMTADDLRLALSAFGRSLTVGGVAIFDVTTERLHDAADHHPVDLHRSATGVVTVRTAYDTGSRTQTARLEVADALGVGVEIHRQRTHTVEDVTAAVTAAGMELVAVHELDEILPAGAHAGGQASGSRLVVARRS